MSKNYFAYVRVSTARQGEHGVSLQQQQAAIESFANRNNLIVDTWFEERQTAAKQGRPVFNRMLAALRAGEARGVIMHKIDRSARNLRDWAAVGELIDSGVEVYFATEALDLSSRGGRLSADIQAVVAADYIRNLREETKKGFYGRLKQGFYPRPAPMGYLDQGPGKAKTPDPDRAPLIRMAFELYASGGYNLRSLTKKMFQMGLTTRSGRRVGLSGVAHILNNPFYFGLIQIRKAGLTYEGAHSPIITKQLFDRVQDVLSGRVAPRTRRHTFMLSKAIRCGKCNYFLIGETHKGHVYYRCHSSECRPLSIREDYADGQIRSLLSSLSFAHDEWNYLSSAFEEFKQKLEADGREIVRQFQSSQARIAEKLGRLTDAYVDGTLEKELYERRRADLLAERAGLQDPTRIRLDSNSPIEHVSKFLELAKSAYSLYEMGGLSEKRHVILNVTSNRILVNKTLEFTLEPPFQLIAARDKINCGAPHGDVRRTVEELMKSLFAAAVCGRGIRESSDYPTECSPSQEIGVH